MLKLNISLKKEVDNSYEIIFSKTPGKNLNNFLNENNKKRILIITDKNIFPLHYEDLVRSLDTSIEVEKIIFNHGEETKNIDNVLKIIDKLIVFNFNRNDLLVAFGGGVIGDMVGFAASIYKRGMDFLQIPTTLLAMFDSSIGGKTGVGYANVKNIIGAFKQPIQVIVNTDYLQTLPKRELLNGYFEGLKHALLDGIEHFKSFKNNSQFFLNDLKNASLESTIAKNMWVKAKLVIEDETEQGKRKFLNYGHTFGHAIESISNYELSHGVAVAYGMIYENILAINLGLLNNELGVEINNFIKQKLIGEKYVDSMDFEDILAKMYVDKKNTDRNISFSLLKGIGYLDVIKISSDQKTLLEKSYYKFLDFIN